MTGRKHVERFINNHPELQTNRDKWSFELLDLVTKYNEDYLTEKNRIEAEALKVLEEKK